ncbi:MAG: tRNA pseudouridine(55) synthase TruB [Lachnospiraceae bacterium]|nr:tRNA pseudouridine(55) synthase TruB [Lachnospiraceae bacterium]
MQHRSQNNYNGMLVVYKEPGFTSSDVVAKLRGILHMRKIGHTGTLDPAAEGVLPVCLGSGTKLVDLIADRDKEYEAILRLGTVTDTQDMTGTVVSRISDEEVQNRISREDILAVLPHFMGEIRQIPPMYSAVWVNGRRLYELARKGQVVERPSRTVVISALDLLDYQPPLARIRVVCSKGTYIRTLCEDIGKALGVGGCMEHLLRRRVGIFTLERAKKLSEIEELAKTDEDALKALIYPVDSFFADAPSLHVRSEDLLYLKNGNPLGPSNMMEEADLVNSPQMHAASQVRVYGEDGMFYALYRYNKDRDRYVVTKMFAPDTATYTC